MIGPLIVMIAIALAAGAAGLWFGIVVIAPRLQRRVDRASGSESDQPAKVEEADGRVD